MSMVAAPSTTHASRERERERERVVTPRVSLHRVLLIGMHGSNMLLLCAALHRMLHNKMKDTRLPLLCASARCTPHTITNGNKHLRLALPGRDALPGRSLLRQQRGGIATLQAGQVCSARPLEHVQLPATVMYTDAEGTGGIGALAWPSHGGTFSCRWTLGLAPTMHPCRRKTQMQAYEAVTVSLALHLWSWSLTHFRLVVLIDSRVALGSLFKRRSKALDFNEN